MTSSGTSRETISAPSRRHLLAQFSHEVGIHALVHSRRDVHLLVLLRLLRCYCFGIIGLVFALYFAALSIPDQRIGLFMSLTIFGDVLLSLLLTFVADTWGRRNTLLVGAILMTCSGIVFGLTENYWVLVVAAVVGVVSPGGGDIGPFRSIEESCISHLVVEKDRTKIFAWYIILAMAASAAGLASSGAIFAALRSHGWDDVQAYRLLFWSYAGCGLVMILAVLGLSQGCEIIQTPKSTHVDSSLSPAPIDNETAPLLANSTPSNPEEPDLSNGSVVVHRSQGLSFSLLIPLTILFSIDSLASSIMPWSLLNLYLARTFPSLHPSTLGPLMSLATLLMSIGTLASAPLATHLGLLPAMISTHVPSAVFLSCIPFAHNSLPLSMVFVFLRALLNSADQAPRSAFLAQMVPANERTRVLGVVNVCRSLAQSLGPSVTGHLAGSGRFGGAFWVAGGLMGVYDVGLVLGMVCGLWGGKDKQTRASVEEEDGAVQEDGDRLSR